MLLTHFDLDVDEKIIYEVRKHWFVFFRHAIMAFILTILPLILYVVVLALLPDEMAENIAGHFFIELFSYALWFLLVWILLFIKWTNYYLDVWYITKKRIIDIEQKGIFHREVSNLRFDKIQDVSVEVRGVIATFLKFGDLRVQTASENSQDFVLKNAALPEEARKVIFDAHNRELSEANVSVDGRAERRDSESQQSAD